MIHGPLILEYSMYANGVYLGSKKHLLLNYGQVQTVLGHVKRMLDRYDSYEVKWRSQDDMGRAYMSDEFDSSYKKLNIFKA